MLLHVQTVLAQGPAGAATRRRSREARRTGALGLVRRTLALTHRRRQRSIIWHPPLAAAEGSATARLARAGGSGASAPTRLCCAAAPLVRRPPRSVPASMRADQRSFVPAGAINAQSGGPACR